jgi:hypothetical protein
VSLALQLQPKTFTTLKVLQKWAISTPLSAPRRRNFRQRLDEAHASKKIAQKNIFKKLACFRHQKTTTRFTTISPATHHVVTTQKPQKIPQFCKTRQKSPH